MRADRAPNRRLTERRVVRVTLADVAEGVILRLMRERSPHADDELLRGERLPHGAAVYAARVELFAIGQTVRHDGAVHRTAVAVLPVTPAVAKNVAPAWLSQ